LTNRTILIFVVGILSASAAEQPPKVLYWHTWTDKQGITHQARCELGSFVLQSISPPAAPQWLDRMKSEGAANILTVLPAGWKGPWHENPKPQWIIPLKGRWFVETTDGKHTEMGPGEITFGEDQNSKADTNGHRGHLSGTVGNEPAVLMIVQLKDSPTLDQPCHFK
jgi:hypothetical protein